MEFVEYVRHGWPYLLVAATHDIDAGQELLVDYNYAYWDSVEARKKERYQKVMETCDACSSLMKAAMQDLEQAGSC